MGGGGGGLYYQCAIKVSTFLYQNIQNYKRKILQYTNILTDKGGGTYFHLGGHRQNRAL